MTNCLMGQITAGEENIRTRAHTYTELRAKNKAGCASEREFTVFQM